MASASSDHPVIGARLRAARETRGLSVRALAERIGVSASLISAVENGRANPSVNTLWAVASELDVSLDELLFVDAPETDVRRPSDDDSLQGLRDLIGALPRDPVQRADSRSSIRLASGVIWERLTTASIPNVDFFRVVYDVGGSSSSDHQLHRHSGYEWGYILSGTLHVEIDADDHVLGPGDAITLDSGRPHRLSNRGSEPVEAIWFVVGRHPATSVGSVR
jgi:transcriptional regulator with XRE-family HTH domain